MPWSVFDPSDQSDSFLVEARSDAGQSITANTTDLQYEDEDTDDDNVWSTDTLTAPYDCIITATVALAESGTATSGKFLTMYINGTLHARATQIDSGSNISSAFVFELASGDTVTFRCGRSITRDTDSDSNWLSIFGRRK